MAFKLFVLAAFVAVASAIEHHGAVSHSSVQHFGGHGYQAAAPAYHAAAPAYHQVAAAPVYHAAPAVYQHAAPVYKHIVQEEHHAPAHYSFEYAVHDEHTGDIKEQKETREGDKVQGYYTLKEADGTRRIVHYTADKHSGFNAVVTHEGKAVHAAPVAHHGYHAAPVAIKAAPVYHAAPIAYKAAPVYHHAAPVAVHAHAAPLAHVAVSAPHHQYHY